jgi:plasmid stabilization system protein ParE
VSRPCRIEPLAEQELRAAADWYEEQRPGLGLDFLAQVDLAIVRVVEGDHGTPVPGAGPSARRITVARYPFRVVFMEHDEQAIVVAFAHERRKPGSWRTR